MKKIIQASLSITLIFALTHCNKDTLPSVPYFNIKAVYAAGVNCYATISDDGGSDITERGFVWKTEQATDFNNNKIAFDNGLNYFETIIYGLSPETTYSIKAFATNSKGSAYSAEKVFTTSGTGTFTDSRDDKTYRWVEIGNQTWMAENLAYMPYVSSYTSDTGIFVYNFKGSSADIAKKQEEYVKYGCLYSWEISLNVCPDGWHLPGEDEWQELERSIGMTSRQISGADPNNKYTAGLLKSPDWPDQYINVTLFSALPGGHHFHDTYNNIEIYFYGLGTDANFWSSTGDGFAYNMTIETYYNITNYVSSKDHGYSVRCVRNR